MFLGELSFILLLLFLALCLLSKVLRFIAEDILEHRLLHFFIVIVGSFRRLGLTLLQQLRLSDVISRLLFVLSLDLKIVDHIIFRFLPSIEKTISFSVITSILRLFGLQLLILLLITLVILEQIQQ